MAMRGEIFPLTDEEDKQRLRELHDNAWTHRQNEIQELEEERAQVKIQIKREFDRATREQAKARREAARPIKAEIKELQTRLNQLKSQLSTLDFQFDQATHPEWVIRRNAEDEYHASYCKRLFAIQDEQYERATEINDRYRAIARERVLS